MFIFIWDFFPTEAGLGRFLHIFCLCKWRYIRQDLAGPICGLSPTCRMDVHLLKIWIDYPPVKIDVCKS